MRIRVKYIVIFSLILLYAGTNCALAQIYVDTIYQIQTVTDILYGNATEFSGQERELKLDISVPLNAPLPVCGRPLVLIIHGGAFLEGSKDDAGIKLLRQDFAKRGYIAASISYRLGFFLTNQNLNCNVPKWNCLNATEESEWIRAWYRGVQDAKGAIRYLLKQTNDYPIDRNQVFLLGESAGGFISLGVAYLDQEAEKPISCGAVNAVTLPNPSYYDACIAPNIWDIPIAQMNTQRPDLGPVSGLLHTDAPDYHIVAVANMFGGLIAELFSQYSGKMPDLYTFHQPNDLIVPFGYSRILQGFNDCAVAANCVNMINRPFVYGSAAITQLIDTLNIAEADKPIVQFEQTTNTSNCIQQVIDPATGGHQYDSYWLRTTQAATFFASRIQENTCLNSFHDALAISNPIAVDVMPDGLRVRNIGAVGIIELFDLSGKKIITVRAAPDSVHILLPPLSGLFIMRYITTQGIQVHKLMFQN